MRFLLLLYSSISLYKIFPVFTAFTFFCNAKYQDLKVSPDCIKPVPALPFYKSSLILNLENVSASEKGNSEGSTGSKSNIGKMKSYKIHKKEAKLKISKKENAQDTISKSFKINYKSFSYENA